LPTLLELQQSFRQALLGGASAEIVAVIEGDGLDPSARLAIYRNHTMVTLCAAMESTFPVVCRLVDKRFLAYAADQFIRTRPPQSRCLVEYGAEFPDFLVGFGPCKDFPYLPDVARFEWALHIARLMRELSSLSARALATIPADKAGYLVLGLQPSARYIASSWPVDAIWQANQQDDVPPTGLETGGSHLEIRRAGGGAVWRTLDAANFAFRTALANGQTLAAAITAAIQNHPDFDPGAALHRMFGEGLVVSCRASPGRGRS